MQYPDIRLHQPFKVSSPHGINLIYRIEGQSELVTSSPIIIFEGILSLYDARIRELMDIKIFVLTDDDIRLARRCK